MNSLVIHYKELALKGRNRPWFVHMLVRHLRAVLLGTGVRAVRAVMGRIEVEGTAETDWGEVEQRVGPADDKPEQAYDDQQLGQREACVMPGTEHRYHVPSVKVLAVPAGISGYTVLDT